MDQAAFVFAPQPAATTLILDSYIVACIQSGIDPLIVYNKCDLLATREGEHGAPGDCAGHEPELVAERTDGRCGVDEERVLGRSVAGGALKTGVVGPAVFDLYRALGYSVVETSSGARGGGGGCSLRARGMRA